MNTQPTFSGLCHFRVIARQRSDFYIRRLRALNSPFAAPFRLARALLYRSFSMTAYASATTSGGGANSTKSLGNGFLPRSRQRSDESRLAKSETNAGLL